MSNAINKTALITGGAGDIGFAAAEKLAEMGLNIVLLDILEPEEGEKKLQHLPLKNGCRSHYLRANVSRREDVEDAIHKIYENFASLDICMCNAGIVVGGLFVDFSVEQWQRHLDINLNGYFHVSQAVARRWIKAAHPGKFIFTGSWNQDVPFNKIAPYCVSKAGVWMLARCMALELAQHGITVNVLAPGEVDAGLSKQQMERFPEMRQQLKRNIPLNRFQTPRDVAHIVGFLASSESDYLTGTSILCDGGCTVGSPSITGDNE
jgi:NAD(P)-dependent dehydrogenase (short-subunit alcohol dehydrogenase family)